MPKLTLVFGSRRGWGVGVLALLAILSVIVVVSALPGLLFGTVLTVAEAEQSIRGHLLTRAAMDLQQRSTQAVPEQRRALQARYSAEIESLKELEFVSVDVDTVVFGFFKIRRSFVAKVITRGEDQQLSTRYYCFVDRYLTGECSEWKWYVAW